MKIVIPGGTGEVGTVLAEAFRRDGHEVVAIARTLKELPWRVVGWDGLNPGDWIKEVDGADVLINLAGRSVNCRYNESNRREIMESRLKSTRAIGKAIRTVLKPPRLWLQASTATIYSHRFHAPNDEITGLIGGNEPDAPASWKFSIDVAKAWESVASEIETPSTRKVLMRTSILMSPHPEGTFSLLLKLVRFGLGGKAGSGRQYISWIHDQDLIRAVYWLIEHDELSGPINLASPNPLSNSEFMHLLRQAYGMRFGLPAYEWQLAIGTFLMRSESELILKSRRVVPTLLTDSGFEFQFPEWQSAAVDLCGRWRAASKGG